MSFEIHTVSHESKNIKKSFKAEREQAKWIKPLYKKYDELHSKAAVHSAVFGYYKNFKGERINITELLNQKQERKEIQFYIDRVLLGKTKTGVNVYYSFNHLYLNLSGASSFRNRLFDIVHIAPNEFYYTLNDLVISSKNHNEVEHKFNLIHWFKIAKTKTINNYYEWKKRNVQKETGIDRQSNGEIKRALSFVSQVFTDEDRKIEGRTNRYMYS